MKTRKLLFFIYAIFCISFVAQAQRGARIGYIDMEYILESVPEYLEASTQLEGKVQRWKQDIDKRQKEIDLMSLNLSNERVLLTKELIDEREEEIKIKEDEMLQYQQDRFGPNGDLMIQRRQLVQPIQDQVFNIVQEIAEAKKYDFIFDKSADVVMLFAAKRNDISDIVLRSINRASKRKEATSKREKKEIEQKDELDLEQEKAVTEKEAAIEEKKDAREKIMEERRKTRDSIRAVKKAVTEKEAAIEEKKDAREKIMEERRKTRDSIRAVKKAEFDARRQKLLDERQKRKDSILEARENKNQPPIGDGDGN